jgi:small GTP-binding protein
MGSNQSNHDKTQLVTTRMSEYKFKVVIVGDSQVGKTNIMTRYVNNVFSFTTQSTFGHEYAKKIVKVEQEDVHLAIWDTAGQERFRSIAAPYYRDSKGGLLVYDVTNRDSFASLTRWIKDMAEVEQFPLIIVGNKVDLIDQRAVSTKEGQEFAKKHSLVFAETSACDGTNIEETFMELVNIMMNKNQKVEWKKNEEEAKVYIEQINKPNVKKPSQEGCSC